MYQDSASGTRTPQTQQSQSTEREESPLPDVPFMGIAAFLGFLVLVLIAAAAYSLSSTLDGFAVDPQLWAPAVFMLLVAGLFWAIDRFQPRSHTR
ncbi:hypothetical protein [Halorubellus sp. PRR65]|uniref:hypothetical protein n=1 Tax=Halorubellus sp. PRR65 TaxID=3098148 RepID=UPI002B25729F|nr:hypothetical protein [Halorubellus sp. PRR65]